MSGLRIAEMALDDVERALDWAAAEGWNPGIEDARAFLAADPTGFLTGWVGETPVACISVVRMNPALGFLGLYLCRPAWRGRGFGRALWQAGLAHLGERSIGLEGVPAQQAAYLRSGFVAVGRTVRHVGAIAAGPAQGFVPLDTLLLGDVLALDRLASGIDRPAYMSPWLTGDRSRRTLVHVVDGAVRGYGTVRVCREGLKIGPLVARDEAAAEALVRALAGLFAERPVAIDVPEANPAAIGLAVRLGLAPVFETARMFRGPAPVPEPGLTWGEATLELG